MRIIFINISLLLSLVLSFLMGTVFSSSVITAQSEYEISSQRTSGVVLKKDNNQITIQNDQGVQEFIIPNNIKITKNGIQSELNNINPNDRVILTLDNSDNILSVEGVTGIFFDVGRWLLPVSAILLMILGVTLVISSKTRRGHFKTKKIIN